MAVWTDGSARGRGEAGVGAHVASRALHSACCSVVAVWGFCMIFECPSLHFLLALGPLSKVGAPTCLQRCDLLLLDSFRASCCLALSHPGPVLCQSGPVCPARPLLLPPLRESAGLPQALLCCFLCPECPLPPESESEVAQSCPKGHCHPRASFAKIRRFHTQLDEGPETP